MRPLVAGRAPPWHHNLASGHYRPIFELVNLPLSLKILHFQNLQEVGQIFQKHDQEYNRKKGSMESFESFSFDKHKQMIIEAKFFIDRA